MECDILVTRGKLKSAAEALLKKECLVEEVIADINRCGIPIEEAWRTIQAAFRGLQCSRLKGRVGFDPKSNHLHIEVPILEQIAQIITDIIGNTIGDLKPGETSTDFLPEKPLGKSLEPRVVPLLACVVLHKEVSIEFEGLEMQVILGDMKLANHTFMMRISILEAPEELQLQDPIYVGLAKVVWHHLK